jgi:hypothetical protein
MATKRTAPNTLLNDEELFQWILRRLGGPIWKVELCKEHVEDAIEWAKRWFAAKKGVKALFTTEVLPNVNCYDLEKISACKIDTVLDVAFAQSKLDLSLIFSPFTLLEEKIPYDVFASGGSAGLYSSYVQSLGYIEVAKRILSAELEWFQEGQTLYVSPIPSNARTIVITAKVNEVVLEQLTERDHDLVKRYALAKAREDIAFIRGKYGDFPGAQGSATLNWAEILEASRTEIEKLEEEIMGSAYPIGFITG